MEFYDVCMRIPILTRKRISCPWRKYLWNSRRSFFRVLVQNKDGGCGWLSHGLRVDQRESWRFLREIFFCKRALEFLVQGRGCNGWFTAWCLLSVYLERFEIFLSVPRASESWFCAIIFNILDSLRGQITPHDLAELGARRLLIKQFLFASRLRHNLNISTRHCRLDVNWYLLKKFREAGTTHLDILIICVRNF